MEKLLKLLKDIFIIAAVGSLSYIALNNTYVRPHIVVNTGGDNIDINDSKNENNNWHIHKKEHKILMGISGHTFLELVNNKNETVEQIHGFAYDAINEKMVESAIKSGFKLKVFNFDYDFYKDEIGIDFPAIVLMTDKKEMIVDTWNKAKSCGEIINQKDINYPRYGFKIISETENSNSVAHSIAICAGLADSQIGLLSPGAKTILLPQESKN